MSLKQQLLTALEQHRDTFLSGQKLADALGVSRNAVWKAICALREEGYQIKAVTNAGYQLATNCDILSADGIRTHLAPTYQDIQIKVYANVDSTNDEAKRLLANGLKDKALIVANSQTHGKGRQGRSFYSPPGSGVYMSLILQPKADLSQAIATTTMAAVAVTEAIEETTTISPQIKWVNDVNVDGKKICGILTEAETDFESGQVQSIIIGIGVNIGIDHLPDELQNIAGSLPSATFKRNELIARITNHLIPLVMHPEDKAYLDSYRSHSLVIGQRITYYIRGEAFTAKALEIDDDGGLIIKKDDGSIDILKSGEISLRISG